MSNLISKRMQKASVGNWGHPSKLEKKQVRIPIEDEEAIPKHKSKKKKNRKPYISLWGKCPFCLQELPLDEKRIKEEKDRIVDKPYLSIWEEMYRVDTCPACKSYEGLKCPACKKDCWYNPETKIYKHQGLSCGFEGKKRGTI